MRWIYVTAAMGLLLSSVPAADLHAKENRLPQTQNKDRRAPMAQLLERKQVPAEHRWNLEDLFADAKAWEKEFQDVKGSISKISAFQGKLNDAAAVKQCFQLEDEVSLKTERLYVYANMKHHEDTAEPTYQALSDKSKKSVSKWARLFPSFRRKF